MSRKYMNNRWCARCNRRIPTPYLRHCLEKHTGLFQSKTTVIDIGCGNGRNSKFMKSNGYKVISIDMVNDYGVKINLGRDSFPRIYSPYDIVLANYVLMFLSKEYRRQVFNQIQKHTKKDSLVMIEMYPAKDAYSYDLTKIIDWFLNRYWFKINAIKDHCLLMRGL